MMKKDIVLFFLFRVFFGIVPNGSQFPDEFWQGPEIAHKDIFGNGNLTWEWTVQNPLRSPIYHSIFNLVFYVLKVLHLDYGALIAYSPRITQCFFSAIYDYYLVKLLQLEGVKSKFLIILINYTTWFSLNCYSKTLINTFESFLFIIAFYNWRLYLKKGNEKNNIYCRCIVALVSASRHSAIIPWVFIWPFHLLTSKTNLKQKAKILFINILSVLLIAAISLTADIIYYKKLTSSFYNFLEFNLLSGNSAFFGVHSKLWFITSGIPFMFQYWSILIIFGIYCYFKRILMQQQDATIFNVTIFTTIILSLPGHKEDRFLLPLFPFFIYFICLGIEELNQYNQQPKLFELPQIQQKIKQFVELIDKLDQKNKKIIDYFPIYLCKWKIFWKLITITLILLGIVSNVYKFLYMNSYRDVGGIQTMSFLRSRENITSVEFFTMCHATPFYSFLHKDIPMYFPDCSPTKQLSSLETYQLHRNPFNYIQQHLELHKPSHVVIYDYFLNKKTKQLFKDYQIVKSIYHHHSADAYFSIQHNVRFIIFEKKTKI